jgi:hypothetical protein
LLSKSIGISSKTWTIFSCNVIASILVQILKWTTNLETWIYIWNVQKLTRHRFFNIPPSKILRHVIPPCSSGCKMSRMVSRLNSKLYSLYSSKNG